MKKWLLVCFIGLLILMLCSCNENHEEFYNMIIDSNIYKSNIAIVEKRYNESDDGVSLSYFEPSSGVILKRFSNTYYALTAYHVINESSSDYYILTYDQSTWSSDQTVGMSSYYTCKANIITYNEKYDLAVLSFVSDKDLPSMKISGENIVKDMEVAAISNPIDKDRNYISFGKILSDELFTYNCDGLSTLGCFTHSAFINKGSSGSMLINTNLEIVGINLGGSRNIFGGFVSGVAINNNDINNFLSEAKLEYLTK